ncbi:MAG: efflux RND transporter periplasmic adaptor subunit [Parachlamydiaceae bacterium]
MRLIKSLSIFFFTLLGVAGLGYYFFLQPAAPPLDDLYEVESPSTTDLKQSISATGKLKIKDQVKIGSVVSGRVKAVHVKENDRVQEGQLLVEIETGLADTEVREAQGAYERAIAELEFYETALRRKQQLFDEHFISDVELEDAKRHYLTTLADTKTLKATYEKRVIAFENSKVYAPTSGVIIDLNVTKGEKVSSDLEGGLLLSFAPDIHHIEVDLEINEKHIGQIQKGQPLELVVDTYPNRVFNSTIDSVSFIAKSDDNNGCVYQAKAYLDNPHLLLRPGMNVNAIIHVASVESALTITSGTFLIKQEHLESTSKLLNLAIHPFSKQDKQALLISHPDENIQFVWAMCESCFKEIPITIGITDNRAFQVKSGLKGDEKLVVDVMEEDEMHKIYEKFYRKL